MASSVDRPMCGWCLKCKASARHRWERKKLGSEEWLPLCGRCFNTANRHQSGSFVGMLLVHLRRDWSTWPGGDPAQQQQPEP